MLGRAAVADHQARPAVAGRRAFAGAIEFQPVDGHAMMAGTGDDGTLEARSGKFKHRMQTGGDSRDLQALAAEGGGQAVPAVPVGEPGPADLPVVAARGDELGQGQLGFPAGVARGDGGLAGQGGGVGAPGWALGVVGEVDAAAGPQERGPWVGSGQIGGRLREDPG